MLERVLAQKEAMWLALDRIVPEPAASYFPEEDILKYLAWERRRERFETADEDPPAIDYTRLDGYVARATETSLLSRRGTKPGKLVYLPKNKTTHVWTKKGWRALPGRRD